MWGEAQDLHSGGGHHLQHVSYMFALCHVLCLHHLEHLSANRAKLIFIELYLYIQHYHFQMSTVEPARLCKFRTFFCQSSHIFYVKKVLTIFSYSFSLLPHM